MERIEGHVLTRAKQGHDSDVPAREDRGQILVLLLPRDGPRIPAAQEEGALHQ